MSVFNVIGRWWGLVLGVCAIGLAGVLGIFLPPGVGFIVGLVIGRVAGLVMLSIGERYS